jgi:hypothetical protein
VVFGRFFSQKHLVTLKASLNHRAATACSCFSLKLEEAFKQKSWRQSYGRELQAL